MPGSGSATFQINELGMAGRWAAAGPGWVQAITVRLNNDRTQGEAEFYVFSESASSQVGPSLLINVGTPSARSSVAGYSVDINALNSFQAGDILRGKVDITTSPYRPRDGGVILFANIATLPYAT